MPSTDIASVPQRPEPIFQGYSPGAAPLIEMAAHDPPPAFAVSPGTLVVSGFCMLGAAASLTSTVAVPPTFDPPTESRVAIQVVLNGVARAQRIPAPAQSVSLGTNMCFSG